MFGFDERDVLEVSLWVFFVGFVVKGVVFEYLWWKMMRQQNQTMLGSALRSHYASLGWQALILAFIYFYYATLLRGWDDWLGVKARVTVYIIATVLVLMATAMGVRLMISYFHATHDDGEIGEPTNQRQDKREVEQNTRETFQDERQHRQDDHDTRLGI